MTSRTLAVVALGWCCTAWAAQDMVLTPRWKSGLRSTYAVRFSFDAKGLPIEVTGTAVDTVIAADADGYIIERTMKDTVLKQAGTETRIDDVGVSKFRMYTNGQLLDILSAKRKTDDLRVASMTQFIAPDQGLSVGKGWRINLKQDAKAGVKATELVYRIAARENVRGQDCAKVSVTGSEVKLKGGLKSTGNVWVSVADGRIVKSAFVLENSLLSGGQGTSATIEQELK